MLCEGNYQKWQWAVKPYQTPHNHVRVIKRVKFGDPTAWAL